MTTLITSWEFSRSLGKTGKDLNRENLQALSHTILAYATGVGQKMQTQPLLKIQANEQEIIF